MFRQDRTNPSTAVSNWRGRHDSAKGWPSTAVSTWLNGGLFGAAVPLTAFGGIITQYVDSGDSKTYRCHTFRGSGKFLVSAGTADVDYLIVAGGGGGGNAGTSRASGGGGAGGYKQNVSGSITVTAQTYPITVGAGGAEAANGSDSVALGVTSTGGGTGGDDSSDAPSTGGSGGGGGFTLSGAAVAGAATTDAAQGYAGGTSGDTGSASQAAGGGGGGGGAVGANIGSDAAGAGGAW